MNELIAKQPQKQPYESFETYKLLRDNTVRVDTLQREIQAIRSEIVELKKLVTTLLNGR